LHWSLKGCRTPKSHCDSSWGETAVQSHINRLFAKTGVRDRAQAVAYAHKRGSPDPPFVVDQAFPITEQRHRSRPLLRSLPVTPKDRLLKEQWRLS
jgi:hypothetical protein